MLLAPLVLVAALGQCPEPPSRNGPPPCAAENVPGCLPGYVRDVDRFGRPIYRCDPSFAAAPGQPPASPPAMPPPPQAQAPRYAPAPPPPYEPRYAPAWAPPPAREGRGQLALLLMPGGSSFDRDRTGDAAGAVGLELRGPWGGARLRGLFEFTQHTRIWDVALKYDFNDRGQVRPFLALGVGAADVRDRLAAAEPGWRPSAAVSAGVDVYLARDLFFTLEAKQRAFTRDTNDGFRGSSLHQTSVFAGLGIYL